MNLSPIALVLVSCLMGCGLVGPPAKIQPPPEIQPDEPNVVSMAPQNWYIYYSEGLPPNPSADTEGAWSFEFPTSETGGHVNYVQTPFNMTTTMRSVTVSFSVESDAPQYVLLDPSDILPATVHLFFEQQNDDLVNPNGRWWAQKGGYTLGSLDNEMISLTVPLDASEWTNVDGQFSNDFSAALANVGWIGLTFGGQYFWGHGVALGGGSAKFILFDMQVN